MNSTEPFNSSQFGLQVFIVVIIPLVVLILPCMVCCCICCYGCKGKSSNDKDRMKRIHYNKKWDDKKKIFMDELSKSKTIIPVLNNTNHDDLIVTIDSPSKKIACYYEINQKTNLDDIIECVNTVLVQEPLPDEVVIRVDSPGGSVSEFGYIYQELTRITGAGIRLVVCADMIAASGGYLISCPANHITAGPFAIIGSIGVICQYPNLHELSKKIGAKYDTFTAGTHKRLYDMFNENNPENIDHLKEELKEIHDQFKNTIKKHRPNVDLDKIGNGDHWLGAKALELKLIDEICTSSQYLMKLSNTHNICEISYKPKTIYDNYLESLISYCMNFSFRKLHQFIL